MTKIEKLRAEMEQRYGVKIPASEILEIAMAEKEMRQCTGCCGLPCRKATNRQAYPRIVKENGRLYITLAECAYSTRTQNKIEGLPRRYADKTYADYEETADNVEAIKMAKWYATEKPRRWLYVYGGCGTGKTFLISLLAKDLMASGMEVIFADFQEILEELKSSFDDKSVTTDAVMKGYRTCEVLILDDVGTGYFRDWGVSVLHNLINSRYNAGKRTLITSNYDLDELKVRLGSQEKYAAARIISRLAEESEVVYMGEEDWRERT